MKNLKLWQKIGLLGLIGLPLALGLGFTPKKNSGLENTIFNTQTITMTTAQAQETNPQGYEVPDLTGYTKVKEGYLDKDKIKDDIKETFVEIFKGPEGDFIMKYQTQGRIWAWGKLKGSKDPGRYGFVDSDCDGVFDKKYVAGEEFDIPQCVK